MTESTADLLRRFYTEVWENAFTHKVDQYFRSPATDDALVPERAVEPEEIREWMNILHLLVRDITVTFLHTMEDGDWCAAFLEVKCTSQRTGKPVKVYKHLLARQSDGRLIEGYPHFDFLGFFQQLEQLPDDAYPLLMGGISLR